MADRKIISVFSATGVLGGSADLNDKSTLIPAMTLAAAVFAITNYWDYMDAAAAGVAYLAAVEAAYTRAVSLPAAFFLPAFFISNFMPGKGMLRQAAADGVWELAMPVPATALLPFFKTRDTAKFVKAAMLHRDKLLGKRSLGAMGYTTFGAVVDGFKKVFPEAGKNTRYIQQTQDEYRGQLTKTRMLEAIAQELLENFLLFDYVGYYSGKSLDETHSFVEDKLTTWEEFLTNSPKFAGLQ
ncbi:hypothetical protein B0H67DRAFT_669385 [Lasiosphaeris hirsuta]|uniref:NmrA-like domain-containing protein n=1 Tax=Lasiosphaeris hirsuta TaxID=260670 RepID=A0AA40A9M2_9PEZI|nr:hypothetical protein B0H67DRAFT_669385 [Lasiosphaeris hirsuta]